MGVRPCKLRVSNVGPISEREAQIARMVAEGKTNKDIAGPIGIRARKVDALAVNLWEAGVERRR